MQSQFAAPSGELGLVRMAGVLPIDLLSKGANGQLEELNFHSAQVQSAMKHHQRIRSICDRLEPCKVRLGWEKAEVGIPNSAKADKPKRAARHPFEEGRRVPHLQHQGFSRGHFSFIVSASAPTASSSHIGMVLCAPTTVSVLVIATAALLSSARSGPRPLQSNSLGERKKCEIRTTYRHSVGGLLPAIGTRRTARALQRRLARRDLGGKV